jgi:CheY-like chemotaxis protein
MAQIRHLMLIDDSDIDLFIQQKIVEITSFADQISTFISPQEALDYLLQADPEQIPELIFLDLNMPLMDGFEVLERMKNHPNALAANYQVVILTSSNSLKDKEKATNYPFVKGFISKPLSEESLNALGGEMSRG